MKVIPKQKRIKIYKKALQVLENDLFLIELGLNSDDGLCMLLDCITFNIHYSKRNMEWLYTSNRFLEFKKYYNNLVNIKFANLYNDNTNLWRRVVLRLILEELKENEEY